MAIQQISLRHLSMNESLVHPELTANTDASLSEYILTTCPESYADQVFNAMTIVSNSSCEMCCVTVFMC